MVWQGVKDKWIRNIWEGLTDKVFLSRMKWQVMPNTHEETTYICEKEVTKCVWEEWSGPYVREGESGKLYVRGMMWQVCLRWKKWKSVCENGEEGRSDRFCVSRMKSMDVCKMNQVNRFVWEGLSGIVCVKDEFGRFVRRGCDKVWEKYEVTRCVWEGLNYMVCVSRTKWQGVCEKD